MIPSCEARGLMAGESLIILAGENENVREKAKNGHCVFGNANGSAFGFELFCG
jgi:hypothetical protein